MAKEVRIHLTAAQKARISAAASKRREVSTPSGKKDLNEPAAPGDSTDLSGSGADLTGSGKPRPTAVIPIP